MKNYYDRNYGKRRKSRSYFYMGLSSAAISAFMITVSVLSFMHEADMAINISGFGSGIVWAIVAVMNMYVYYHDNRIELKTKFSETAENINSALKKL